ncbi:MAG: AAA family ATPase [Alistipes sp.]|nr:AAA family ATPase [Alistipes sp.]
MAVLESGQRVDGYFVQSLIKANVYTETYRVEDESHQPFFMKVYIMKLVPSKLINPQTGVILEIEYSQKIKSRNVASFISSGTISTAQSDCQYYTTNYFSGELVAEKLYREHKFSEAEAVRIFAGVLEGLQTMHSQGIYHNDITPRNIMLSATASSTPEIIDLGHASQKCSGDVPFDTSDLELFYSANETFAGMYDERSDIFAATAVFYTMLTGRVPWHVNFEPDARYSRKAMIIRAQRADNPIDFSLLNIDIRLMTVLSKGLAIPFMERYYSVEQVLKDLDAQSFIQQDAGAEQGVSKSEMKGEPLQDKSGRRGGDERKPQRDDDYNPQDPNRVNFEIKTGGGNGFADIAGMSQLKSYLEQRVLFVLRNKEKAAQYRVTIPNGMLLYGPPGCGKTFISEKFAEESQFNFVLVKSSDLASSFVHGGQEKIGKLFKMAERHAPIVICFDEFDALVPDRSSRAAEYSSGEVNEFLSQLNNCSKRGIFVIGTTNRPDKIDPAVLRTGRMDKQVYVPLPDCEARREMFLVHLKGRPCSEDIDAQRLAELTEGFIASDIAYVVNDAAMVSAYTDTLISQQILETTISNTHPSLRPDTLKVFEEIRRKMEGIERDNTMRKIGYRV